MAPQAWFTNWYFVNVTTNTILYNYGKIENGKTYSFASLGRNLSIQLDTNSVISSVNFTWPTGFTFERGAPFALQGNSGVRYIRATYLSTPELKTITAVAFQQGLNGAAYISTLSFRLV
jgi:hypothetical protein